MVPPQTTLGGVSERILASVQIINYNTLDYECDAQQLVPVGTFFVSSCFQGWNRSTLKSTSPLFISVSACVCTSVGIETRNLNRILRNLLTEDRIILSIHVVFKYVSPAQ